MKRSHDIQSDPDYRNLGPAVAAAREGARMTKTDLAFHLKVSRQTVVQIENGERRVDVVELARIAAATGCSPVELFVRATAGMGGQAPAPDEDLYAEELLALA